MPRTPRVLAPWRDDPEGDPAIYHCTSRVVNRDLVLGPVEKEFFVNLMRRYERFCGVHILTHCVMSNHFHLLVEVPPRPVEGLSDEDFCDRLAILYSKAEVKKARSFLRKRRKIGDHAGAEAFKEKHLYRMWDLSEFMKTLKQCFTRWFNVRHDRHGTLWEERFGSVLVEGGYAARVVAAYIDLNPVRAGLVSDPKDYRWCGYAEAVAGNERAREGIGRIFGECGGVGRREQLVPDQEAILAGYRMILFEDGEEKRRENPVTGEVEVARRGMSREEVEEVLASGGRLSRAETLRCRVRALSQGVVLGSRAFVEELAASACRRPGAKRPRGARPLRGCEIDLCCLQGRQQDILG